MKIRLLNPPQKLAEKDVPLISPPLSIMYISAVLKERGYEAPIDDFLVSKELQIKKEKNFSHLGWSWDKIRAYLQENKSDVVGVTNLFTSQLEYALKLCELVKEINPETKVIIGGPHASAFPEEILKHDFIDYVVVGEGEYVFADLIDAIKNNKDITGLAYKKGTKRAITNKLNPIEDLDKLPLPAYSEINLENYFKVYKKGFESRPDCSSSPRVISMITSRGCPFDCVFCSIHGHMGKKYRVHSVDYVIKHIKFLKENYNIEHIHFEDDNLTLNVRRFEEILDGLIEEKINIKWDTPNGVRADKLNFRILKKAKQSGCSRLKIAAESGDQEILDKVIKKNLDLEEIKKVAKICQQLKIPLGCFFIFGVPGETLKDIDTTFRFAYNLFKKYDVLPHFNQSRPSVGTELYDLSKEKGYIKNPSQGKYIQYDNPYIETEEFNMAQLRDKSNIFYRKIFFLHIWKLASNPSFSYRFFKFYGLNFGNLFRKALAYIQY